MEAPKPASSSQAMKGQSVSRSRVLRSVLLAIAGVWFVILALPFADGEPTLTLLDLGHRLALGFALVTVALIDWSVFAGLFGIE